MNHASFYWGVCAGMVLGAAAGMAVVPKKHPMKTCVGRTMEQMGNAMDDTIDRVRCCMCR